MKRILLVDDEPAVLLGIRHALRSRRSEWETVTATSPKEACDLLDRDPEISVLICDLAMPGGGGEVVLRHARDNHPLIPRIILSGNLSNTTLTKKAIPLAHRFLEKPCTPMRLQETIDWVIEVRPEELLPVITE